MEGSLGWDSREGFEAMQRYHSAAAHAFQPFQGASQEHVGSVRVSENFEPSFGSPIPLPPPLIANMFGSHSKRKAVEEVEDDEFQILPPSAPKKRGGAATTAVAKKPRNKSVKKDNEEDEEGLGFKNWRDQDVETIIALHGEMEPEFLKNSKKQGVDMWVKLHARLIAVIPGLNWTAEACKKKFNTLSKLYKEDKMANGISGSDRHACKFYDSFYQWWHQTGTVMKHVTAFANDSASKEDCNDTEKEPISNVTPTLAIKVEKKNFQEQCYGVFMQMAENSSVMVKNFEKTNALLEKVEKQMDRLIDKL